MPELESVTVVGAGRLGTALTSALRTGGLDVDGPLRRGETPSPGAAVVLLCVPDQEIGAAARTVPPSPLVGHCSGATTLEPLAGHRAFSMHPLMTVPAEGTPDFRGVACAVAGDPVAARLAELLGIQQTEAGRDLPSRHVHGATAED